MEHDFCRKSQLHLPVIHVVVYSDVPNRTGGSIRGKSENLPNIIKKRVVIKNTEGWQSV